MADAEAGAGGDGAVGCDPEGPGRDGDPPRQRRRTGRQGKAEQPAEVAGLVVGAGRLLAVFVARIGRLPRIGLVPSAIAAAWRHPGTRTVLQKMAPALLGVSVAQLSLVINTQIASHVAVGAVSWLTYADRLMEFPTALLGVALSIVLLPQLSAAQARQDAEAYSGLLDCGLRMVLMLALPSAESTNSPAKTVRLAQRSAILPPR